jgi:cell division protein FtsQ
MRFPVRRHEPEPDPAPAALDELLEAFGVDTSEFDGITRHGAPGEGVPAPEVEREGVRRVPPPGRAGPVAPVEDPGTGEATAPAPAPRAPASAERVATVISIEDDELPDPVYLEGQLDGPGGSSGTHRTDGSVVFIDDDGSGDTLSPAASRRIEPRFRERRIAVRRAEGRKRLRWLAVLGVVVVLLVGALAVLGSPLFSVEEVVVVGAVYTDEVALAEVVAEIEGTPTLLVDTQGAERTLRAIPWVADARVTTSFPRSATIEIRERVALAAYQGPDARFRVLDREARVLDVLDGQPIAYVPVTSEEPPSSSRGSPPRSARGRPRSTWPETDPSSRSSSILASRSDSAPRSTCSPSSFASRRCSPTPSRGGRR